MSSQIGSTLMGIIVILVIIILIVILVVLLDRFLLFDLYPTYIRPTSDLLFGSQV